MGAVSPLDQIGPTQRRLLEALLQSANGRSVGELTHELGITATAVRQHLSSLENSDLVEYTTIARERGRPQHRYQLSAQGHEVFPRRYRELAEVLLAELGDHLGPEALPAAMRRMGTKAAATLGTEIVSVGATARLMSQLGYEAHAQTDANQHEEIVAMNCVFHKLAERTPAVCAFDLGFMEAASGRAVEHRECMVRGSSLCRFRFSKTQKKK